MELTTTKDVIERLGGVSAVAELARRGSDAVYHWRKTNKFPAHSYNLLRDALNARGCTAPDHLWRMTEPVE